MKFSLVGGSLSFLSLISGGLPKSFISIPRIRRRLDVGQGGDEVAENLRRDHDRVTVPGNILGDFHHHAARVFLQIEEESLSISENFFGV
jgi:hypothetical protein